MELVSVAHLLAANGWLTFDDSDAGAGPMTHWRGVRVMARSVACLWVVFLLCLVMTGTAAGQATVEAGLGAAGAVTTAAPARGIGEALNGLAGSLEKTVGDWQHDSDAKPGGTVTVQVPAKRTIPAAKARLRSSHIPPPPTQNWEDPGGIQAGLSYAEMVRRFGPPTMEIMDDAGRSLSYSGKDGPFQVHVSDDKVTSIEKPKS